MDLIPVIKALSDETRIRIVNLLRHGELCVCEIEAILDINQSNASRHLNKLANAKIITYFKVAKYVYYKLNEDIYKEFPFVKSIIEEEVSKLSVCEQDYKRMKKYKDSGLCCDDLKEGIICFKSIKEE